MAVSSYGNIHTQTFSDLEANSTVEANVLVGSGRIYSIEIDNTNNKADSFLKIWDNIAPSITTAADFIFKVPGGEKIPFLFGSGGQGVALSSGLSFACVITGGDTGSTSPASKVPVVIKTD